MGLIYHQNSKINGRGLHFPSRSDFVMTFDGSGDYVNGVNLSSAPSTNPFSICMWIQVDTFAGGVSYNIFFGDNAGSLYMGTYATDQLVFNVGAFIHNISGYATYMIGHWRRMWFIRPSGASVRIAIWGDGVKLGEDAAAGNPDVVTSTIRVGGWTGGTYSVDGRMRDVRFYRREVTSTEIKRDFAGSVISDANLERRWLFKQKTGAGKTLDLINQTYDTVTGATIVRAYNCPWA